MNIKMEGELLVLRGYIGRRSVPILSGTFHHLLLFLVKGTRALIFVCQSLTLKPKARTVLNLTTLVGSSQFAYSIMQRSETIRDWAQALLIQVAEKAAINVRVIYLNDQNLAE